MTRSNRRAFLSGTLHLAAAGGIAAVTGAGSAACGAAPSDAATDTPGTATPGTATPETATPGTGTPPRPGARPAVDYPPPGEIGPEDLVHPDVLWDWVERMTGVGPRFTGSPAHRRFVDDLERQLRGHGLEVTRYPTPLAEWLARSWSLRVVDTDGTTHTVPVAYYRPCSGETLARGVTGPVVDVGAGAPADYESAAEVTGAVVLADAPVARLTATVLADLADEVHPPQAREEFAREDYSRVWLGVPPPPDLAAARSRGAVGMIEISDLTPPLAAGQYTPHQQEHAGLPALRVDREQGARLRAMLARGPLTATLVLTASRRRSTVDYLLARLPGAGGGTAAPDARRTVLVATHTDGQNAIEENGGPALLALAEYFSRFPPATRPRDLLFMFSPSHMTSDAATVKPDVWLRGHPEITAGIDMALVAEHLGALGWDDQGGTATYRATGRSEPVAVAVGNSGTLRRLARDEVVRSDLTRTGIQRPFQDGLYGEGTFAYRLGIPTVAMITGPVYLLQVTRGDNLDKLDRGLLHQHTLFLARLLSRMIALPPGVPD